MAENVFHNLYHEVRWARNVLCLFPSGQILFDHVLILGDLTAAYTSVRAQTVETDEPRCSVRTASHDCPRPLLSPGIRGTLSKAVIVVINSVFMVTLVVACQFTRAKCKPTLIYVISIISISHYIYH